MLTYILSSKACGRIWDLKRQRTQNSIACSFDAKRIRGVTCEISGSKERRVLSPMQ